MAINLLSFIKNNLLKFSVFFLFLLSSNSYSQCAGEDSSVTICDIANPTNSNINLFSLLGGSPAPGGIWVDNSKPLEESIFNGFLNAQALRNSGVYSYTYVQDPSSCTDNEATVTLIIGPYAGVPSPNVSTCDDVESFNLFQAFDGTKLAPQQNGTWKNSVTNAPLSGNTINPKALGEGNYSYTYTIPALDTCPEQSATVFIAVFRKPKSGTPSDLVLCSNADLTLYRNVNLNDLLLAEDAGGRWTEAGTNELTTLSDNRINVENIYNTLGAGTYNFVYTVLSSNPICTNSQSTVQIVIEEPLNFTGSTLIVNSDICENQITTATYNAILRRGPQIIPNGSYDVSYTIFNGTTTNFRIVNGNFVNGNFVFDIDEDDLQAVGDYTFTITNIVNTASRRACTNILGTISDVLSISPLPRINNATVTIEPICKGLDAQVVISGNTNLANGTYRVSYTLSGDNVAASQQIDFTATNGVAQFSIPATLIPNVGVNTVLNFTNIINLTSGCSNPVALSKAFTVKPLPNVGAVALNANNICLGHQDVSVQLSGLGNLTNITVDYSLTDANTLLNQNITLTVSAGNASFTIPASALLNTGNTTITLNSILDNSNGCSAVVLNKTRTFVINSIPNAPATNSFSFCKNDLRTIANLTPAGAQYQWFDSVSSTTALSTSTLLVTGTYYVKEVNPTTTCESGRTAVTVTVNELDTPVLDADGQNFCGLDNPTIQNLSDRTSADDELVWFDALENGNQLSANTALAEARTYYAYSYSSTTNCYSDPLEVTVSLSNCDVPDDFFIPDGFSPNGDQKNDVFRISNIEFIYPDFTLEIYNRYGNLMFKGNRSKTEWDGRNSDYKIGVDGIAPNGVYFYVLHFNKGNKKPTQGRLYLNR
ncbi:hypothetical protein GCM10008015_28220 [Flavobacterium palustre]|uniref:Ig-like domain-containing protein n=1 Tax=Flavobacterium palustre TaxID=1476463 RepID=A0ABQ1HRC5_9FLAO|nr:gliding motility-associated C-terminal domain-containing protein [Flavobacterium palustre]GGA85863.1 hypothetical protein GCM10008015_28220 [Flavobacterium palustre]